MTDEQVIFRVHAVQQMFRRGISEVEVRAVLEEGEVIENYPNDLPFPSNLLLGWIGTESKRTPLHVVASQDSASRIIFIVTVYEPSSSLWEPGLRRRKKI